MKKKVEMIIRMFVLSQVESNIYPVEENGCFFWSVPRALSQVENSI